MSHVGNDLLADFLEGLLPADDEAQVAAHLRSCPTCARARDALLDTRVLLRQAGAEPLPMPPEVAERLEAALAAESRARSERTGVVSLRTGDTRHDREGPARRGRRRRATGWRAHPARVILAAAASVAVLAAGAVAARGILTSDTTTVAGGPPTSSTPTPTAATTSPSPSLPGPRTFAFKTRSKVPSLSREGFAVEVGQLIEARPASSSPTQKGFGLSNEESSGVAANANRCVVRILGKAGAGTPLDVIAGELDGRPVQVAIVVEGDTGGVRAYAIEGCPAANARIVHQASVSPR